MSNTLRAEIIARDFNRMLEELAGIEPRIEWRHIVIGSAERVVNAAQRYTKTAKASKIKEDFETKQYTTFGGKRYKLSNRYRDALWREILARRLDKLEVRLGARGLSRQSWIHVGASFGAPVSAPGFVSDAHYKGKRYAQDGASHESGSGADFALTIINTSPIVQAAGGRNALLRAMRGETQYFRRNIETGAFRTFESRAKKYPQIFARPGL